MEKRIHYIDALKGLTIICVVAAHVIQGYNKAGMYLESGTFMTNIDNLIGVFHMPLFMMISGFVFCKAYMSNGYPDRSRVVLQALNLTVIYFTFSLIYGLLKVLAAGYVNSDVSLADVAMIAIKPIDPYWYLYTLILFYTFFSVRKIQEIRPCVMIAFLTIISLASQLIQVSYFSLGRTMRLALFFYIGIMYKKQGSGIVGNKVLTSIVAAAALLLVIVFWDGEKNLYSYFAVGIFIGFGVSTAIWYVFENVRNVGENRFLQFLGRHSIEIYVIHCVFTAGLRPVMIRLGIDNVYLSFALNTVISTAIPLIFGVTCQKLGIYELFFKPVTFIKAQVKKT